MGFRRKCFREIITASISSDYGQFFDLNCITVQRNNRQAPANWICSKVQFLQKKFPCSVATVRQSDFWFRPISLQWCPQNFENETRIEHKRSQITANIYRYRSNWFYITVPITVHLQKEEVYDWMEAEETEMTTNVPEFFLSLLFLFLLFC